MTASTIAISADHGPSRPVRAIELIDAKPCVLKKGELPRESMFLSASIPATLRAVFDLLAPRDRR